ncbi:hypothetical protein HYT92_03240 [Candidatus Pacearchaeota archaeon]|nr:hypothetical protein [Candidatus Pacearchaeota archaeon]
MSYDSRIRYHLRKFAKECGFGSAKELRKNMKEFGLNYSVEEWIRGKMFQEEYFSNLEEIEKDAPHLPDELSLLVA